MCAKGRHYFEHKHIFNFVKLPPLRILGRERKHPFKLQTMDAPTPLSHKNWEILQWKVLQAAVYHLINSTCCFPHTACPLWTLCRHQLCIKP